MVIQPLAKALSLNYCHVDIADDDDLVTRYGIRIPVLFSVATQAELGWPFNSEQARQFMESQCQS